MSGELTRPDTFAVAWPADDADRVTQLTAAWLARRVLSARSLPDPRRELAVTFQS